jgi:hypothetical protein
MTQEISTSLMLIIRLEKPSKIFPLLSWSTPLQEFRRVDTSPFKSSFAEGRYVIEASHAKARFSMRGGILKLQAFGV